MKRRLKMQGITQNIFDIFDELKNEIYLKGIRLTAGQISLVLSESESAISYESIKIVGDKINADVITTYDNHFVLATYEDSFDQIQDENIQFLRKIVTDMADIICACTGNEIYIDEYNIKCFLDISELALADFTQINNVFEDDGLIIFAHRPYVLFNRPVEVPNDIIIEDIGGE